MSAFLVISTDTQAHLFSDALHYTDKATRTIARVASKIRRIDQRTVFTGRGNTFDFSRVGDALERNVVSLGFDELLRAIPRLVATRDAFDMALAGWSDDLRKPRAAFVRFYDRDPSEMPDPTSAAARGAPFYPSTAWWGMPWINPGFLATDGIRFSPNSVPASADSHAVRWFQCGRRMMGGYIGGFIERATVTEAGIDQQIVHRWPADVAGGRLNAGAT
jgi:hypothetical protein